MPPVSDIPSLLRERLRAQGPRPWVTAYDGEERAELSWTAAAGWAFGTAALLDELLGGARGARIGLTLRTEWTTAVAALGVWQAGAVLVPIGAGAAADVDVVLVHEDRRRFAVAGRPVVIIGVHADARPTDPLDGALSWVDEVQAQPDDHVSDAAGDDVALADGRTQRALLAAHDGLSSQDRLLLVAEDLDVAALVGAVAGTAAVGARLVLVRGDADAEHIASQEATTTRWPR